MENVLPKQAGVYAIWNLVNRKMYIGSSVNMFERLRLHRKLLRRQVHFSSHLQAAWNMYGEEQFVADVIELVCVPSKLVHVEQYWINVLRPWENGYNSRIIASNNAGIKLKISKEQRMKMSQSRRGRPNGQKGVKQSQETIEKRRLKLIGQKRRPQRISLEVYDARRAKISKALKGRQNIWHIAPSPLIREKLSKALSQSWIGRKKIYYGFVSPGGIHIGAVVDLQKFCTSYHLNHQNLSAVYHGKRVSHKGWTRLRLSSPIQLAFSFLST